MASRLLHVCSFCIHSFRTFTLSRFHGFTALRFHAFMVSRFHAFALSRFHVFTVSRFHGSHFEVSRVHGVAACRFVVFCMYCFTRFYCFLLFSRLKKDYHFLLSPFHGFKGACLYCFLNPGHVSVFWPYSFASWRRAPCRSHVFAVFWPRCCFAAPTWSAFQIILRPLELQNDFPLDPSCQQPVVFTMLQCCWPGLLRVIFLGAFPRALRNTPEKNVGPGKAVKP